MEKYNKELEASKDNFKNGPIGKRSVTDCLCCLIFDCWPPVCSTGLLIAS